MESAVGIILGIAFFFAFGLIILYLWSIVWSYNDAVKRGKSGFAVALITAFLAWPFGLLFWSIARPEKIKGKQPKTPKYLKQNVIVSSFKKMPFLLKVFFLLSIYGFVEATLNIFQMKPINFSYFGTSFLSDYPLVWHLYGSLLNLAMILVYLKRSYSILKKYLYISVGLLSITLLHHIYTIIQLPVEQRGPSILLYSMVYVFAGLIVIYQLEQKKYFDRP